MQPDARGAEEEEVASERDAHAPAQARDDDVALDRAHVARSPVWSDDPTTDENLFRDDDAIQVRRDGKTTSTRSAPRAQSAMARERELPLVLAVDCCRDDALERDALAGVARFRSVSSEDEACASLVEEATVLVLRTASPQPPVVARAVFMPALVVALGSPDAALETAAARRAGATRFLHAPLDAMDALADTATLALDGARHAPPRRAPR